MKRLLLILFTGMVLLTNTGFQQQADTSAKIKAVFLYNFTKYIEWPQSYREGNFVIAVYGSGSKTLVEELNKMAATKTVGSQKFEIKTITSLADVGKTNILFMPGDASFTMNDLLGKVKGKSVLLVTEKAGLAKQGSAINFVVQENKQKFELNKANAEKYDLKVSSNLLSLAIAVE